MAASVKHKLCLGAEESSRDSSSGAKKEKRELLFIIPTRIQKKRLELMKKSALKKGLPLAETFSSGVTHVATACETAEQVIHALKCRPEVWCEGTVVLKLDWMSECLRQGKLVPILDEHRISMEKTNKEPEDLDKSTEENREISDWACQRPNPLNHVNEKLTKPLEILEENAKYNNDEKRALAFRRGSATLRSLPRTVRFLHEVNGLPNVGPHCRRVIQDVLNYGFSQEAEDIKHNPDYQKIKAFTGIFGVGPTTAKQWISQGLNTIEDVRNSTQITGKDDDRMAIGLAFYEDLNLPVLKCEVEHLVSLVKTEAQKILPGCTVTLAGGFRRGKSHGHDVDLLLSHPEEGRERVLLNRLLLRLDELDLIVNGRLESSSFTEENLRKDTGQYLHSSLDHFEKWLGVMKFRKEYRTAVQDATTQAEIQAQEVLHSSQKPQSVSGTLEDTAAETRSSLKTQSSYSTLYALAKSERDWFARRVDLIVVPASQYYWALVGWTGSRQFNRSLRLYAQTKNMKLTSHGLWDLGQGKAVPAGSEKDVFDAIGVPYQPPHLRNA